MKINFYCSVAVTQLRLAELEKNRKFDQLVCIAKDAAAAWSSIIQGVLDIQINCVFVRNIEMLTPALGICIPNFITITKDYLGPVWAPKFEYSLITTAQAKALGTLLDPNAGNIDMVIFINFDGEYNFTQNAISQAELSTGIYKRSFKSVFMHEICHGLGFGSSWDSDNNCTNLNQINYPDDQQKHIFTYVPFKTNLNNIVQAIRAAGSPYPIAPFVQFFFKQSHIQDESMYAAKFESTEIIWVYQDNVEHITVLPDGWRMDRKKTPIKTLMNYDVQDQILEIPDEYTIYILNQIFWRFQPPSNAWCNIL